MPAFERDVISSIFGMFVHNALPIAIAHDRTLVPVVLVVKCRGRADPESI